MPQIVVLLMVATYMYLYICVITLVVYRSLHVPYNTCCIVQIPILQSPLSYVCCIM